MPRRLLLGSLCAFTLLAAAPSAQAVTTYRGQFQCSDRGTVRPVAGAVVELWSRGATYLPVELVGRRVDQGHTGDDGRFSLQAPSDRDGYYARVVFTDARGLHVRNIVALGDLFLDSPVVPNDSPAKDLGGILSGGSSTSSPPCELYGAFHDTWSDYLTAVGSAPPFRALSINAYVPFIGVPFTAPGSIQWPATFNVGATPGAPTVPAHEFAHAFRFDFDGDYAHFLLDVVAYAYPQNHNICDLKNAGFAFNEGWAEYWSREVTGQPECPGRATDNFQVEGRVAAALAELESRCAGGVRRTMVDVLRANRGTIHSFAEFRDRLPCPAPAPASVPPQSVGVYHPTVASIVAAAALHAQVTTLGHDIKALQRRLPAAVKAARHAPPCVRTPCLGTLKAETRLPGLRGEIAMLRLRRAGLIGLLSPATMRKLGRLNAGALARNLAARNRRLALAMARAGRKALRAMLRNARAVLRHDRSRGTRRLAKLLRARLAQLRRAVRSGKLPAGFAGLPDGTKPPRRAGVRAFPPRQPGAPALPSPVAPTPAPDTRADTTLSLSCPSVVAPKPLEVSGNLSPTVAGATVHVSYSSPKTGTTKHDTTTDVNGDYHDALAPTTADNYTVQASWDGDGAHKPASAPGCAVIVGS